MAYAIPVTAPEEAPQEAPKEEVKKAPKGKKATVSEEVMANLAGTDTEEVSYRSKGGKKLENHEAIREDF